MMLLVDGEAGSFSPEQCGMAGARSEAGPPLEVGEAEQCLAVATLGTTPPEAAHAGWGWAIGTNGSPVQTVLT